MKCFLIILLITNASTHSTDTQTNLIPTYPIWNTRAKGECECHLASIFRVCIFSYQVAFDIYIYLPTCFKQKTDGCTLYTVSLSVSLIPFRSSVLLHHLHQQKWTNFSTLVCVLCICRWHSMTRFHHRIPKIQRYTHSLCRLSDGSLNYLFMPIYRVHAATIAARLLGMMALVPLIHTATPHTHIGGAIFRAESVCVCVPTVWLVTGVLPLVWFAIFLFLVLDSVCMSFTSSDEIARVNMPVADTNTAQDKLLWLSQNKTQHTQQFCCCCWYGLPDDNTSRLSCTHTHHFESFGVMKTDPRRYSSSLQYVIKCYVCVQENIE